MEEKDFYVKMVEEGSKIRYEINEEFYKRKMNPIQEIVRFLVGLTPEEYKFIHDMNYYQHGGFPFPDSPPKLDAFLDKLILLIKYFHFLGWEDRINSRINEQGVFIKLETPLSDESVNRDFEDDDKAKKRFYKNWDKVFGDFPLNYKTKKQTLEDFLSRTKDMQFDICTLANKIKDELSPAVEEKCKIKKPNFEKAVQIKYKLTKNEMEDKDSDEEIQKAKDDIENQIDAISIF